MASRSPSSIKRRCWRFVSNLLREEDGPTAVEYAVMLALIIGVCAGTVNTLADSLNTNLENSADAIINASN